VDATVEGRGRPTPLGGWAMVLAGRLVLCPTPIGNLEDITLRALRALREADLVLCEDTRRTGRLLRHYGVSRPVISYHKWNEKARRSFVLDALREGRAVVLVSDAGSPLLADPGWEIVREAIRMGHKVEALPGPQAVVPALTLSGLPTLPFYVEGFLPKVAATRRRRLSELRFLKATLVFFESPERLPAALQDMAEVFGDREAAVARELTKLHEEVARGRLADLVERFRHDVRGECVVVVAGAEDEALETPETFVAELRRQGVPARKILELGVGLGFRRRTLYDLLLRR
jgi:16S rRNA (cytidine1402-2'-O)-methyltransferase